MDGGNDRATSLIYVSKVSFVPSQRAVHPSAAHA
jgi:hypothetical protein